MKLLVQNRKASYNYFLTTIYEAGIILKGTEVKSLSKSNASLDAAYVLIKRGEIFILGLHIAPYDHGNIFNVDPLRTRKLLLHKKEILKLHLKIKQEKAVLVPTKIYFKKNKIKVSFAFAKPKKLYDKREDIKLRDLKRKVKTNY